MQAQIKVLGILCNKEFRKDGIGLYVEVWLAFFSLVHKAFQVCTHLLRIRS